MKKAIKKEIKKKSIELRYIKCNAEIIKIAETVKKKKNVVML